MKHRTLKIAAAVLLTSSCLILPVAAADMGNNTDPRAVQNFFSPAPRDGQSMPGGMGDSGLMGTPDGNSPDMNGGSGSMGNSSGDMFDTTDGNLGDTSGPMESGDGIIEGTGDTNLSPMGDMAGNSANAGDTAGDTAGNSSGTTDEESGSMLGIIITLLLIGAVVILIFALIPKRKS
jgi:hypothetical protein